MIKLYFLTLTVFLSIDALWLTLIAKNFYAKYLGFLMSKTPNLAAAGIFYLIYVLALLVFVLLPSLEKKSLMQAITMGALFGFSAYATYDLTNLATIKNWPLLITVVDLIWGTILSALVAGISFSIFRWKL